MSSPVQESTQNISNLLAIDEEYASPAIVAQTCRQKNWAEEHRRSIENPEAFWGDYAGKFVWTRPWEKVLDWDGVHHQWFQGAKTNITMICAYPSVAVPYILSTPEIPLIASSTGFRTSRSTPSGEPPG